MDELGETLGIRQLDEWYSKPVTEVIPLGDVDSLLKTYNYSLSKLLMAVYPEHSWDLSRFAIKPRQYWSSLENQRAFMDEMGDKLGLKDLDGWYAITVANVIPLGAKSILNLYNSSLSKLLMSIYPNHHWDISKFSSRPRNYWSSLEKQKLFVDELGKKIGVNSEADMDKWYEISVEFFQKNGGYGLLIYHKKSLPKLLAAIYPNYNWQLWRFQGKMSEVLASEEEKEKLFAHLEKALEIRQAEDWYRVTTDQLAALKVPLFYKSIEGGLVMLLSKRYPNVKWDEEAFLGRGYRRATQRWLATMLSDLLHSEEMLVDDSHPELKCQLDVYFPHLNLAFEYQGAQHYEQIGVYGDVSDRMARDETKAARCLSKGISLITVPFWWNKKRPALLTAILAERPDLFTNRLAPFLKEARLELRSQAAS